MPRQVARPAGPYPEMQAPCKKITYEGSASQKSYGDGVAPLGQQVGHHGVRTHLKAKGVEWGDLVRFTDSVDKPAPT